MRPLCLLYTIPLKSHRFTHNYCMLNDCFIDSIETRYLSSLSSELGYTILLVLIEHKCSLTEFFSTFTILSALHVLVVPESYISRLSLYTSCWTTWVVGVAVEPKFWTITFFTKSTKNHDSDQCSIISILCSGFILYALTQSRIYIHIINYLRSWARSINIAPPRKWKH